MPGFVAREKQMYCDSCAHLKVELDGALRSGVEVSRKFDAAVEALNKIHDLAGEMGDHPHAGAIQAWVHTVLPCPAKPAVTETSK